MNITEGEKSTCEGMTEALFTKPFRVIAFPNSNSYEPTPGLALGVETNEVYGGERVIVRYDSIPRRKVTGEQTPWPNGIVYLSERDVDGWKATSRR